MLDLKKILAGATIAASALVVPMTLTAQPASAATEVATSVGVQTAIQGHDDDGPRKRVKVNNQGGNIGNGNGGNANDSTGDFPGGNGGDNNSGDVNIGNDD
ncbi:hypothetical protein ACFXJ8_13700 [Nonomuraea sp. NPDC059194]|uniref:hypothetical protein n=1 Tax=Nonomuraea sp. NPDC059194 TaxID=3346764 RepID=UPI00367525F7